MRLFQSLLLFACIIAGTSNAAAQGAGSDVQGIVDQLNANIQIEPGCSTSEYSIDGCTFQCTLNCEGSEFVLSFDLGKIGRVYKDKADFEDTHETLFFECKKAKECVKCNSELIPPSPVFSIKLPAEDSSTLGEDAVKVFGTAAENCK